MGEGSDGAIRNPRGISLWTGDVCDHVGMTWGFCCDCDTCLGPPPEETSDG